jgi:hypothetical protein
MHGTQDHVWNISRAWNIEMIATWHQDVLGVLLERRVVFD